MRKIEGELTELGFPVIALSPDRPEKLLESRKAKSIDYALYSDSEMAAARAFGIAFQLNERTRKQYKGFGIDLADSSGADHGQLPVPSVFLVDAKGVIRWAYSNPDYKVRPDNKEVLEAARASARPEGSSSDAGQAD